jgi:hypothetical protein
MTSAPPDPEDNLNEPDDTEWLFLSCTPLERAAARLNAVRQTIPTIYKLGDNLVSSARSDAEKMVQEMRQDPEWHLEADTTEEGLKYHLAMTSYELPVMLIGQMVVYLLSVLEVALSEGLAVIVDRRGVAEAVAPKGPKIEGYVKLYSSLFGVKINWSRTTWRELREWRGRRNSFVHGLDLSLDASTRRDEYVLQDFWQPGEIPSLASVDQLLSVVGTALNRLDESIDRATP